MLVTKINIKSRKGLVWYVEETETCKTGEGERDGVKNVKSFLSISRKFSGSLYGIHFGIHGRSSSLQRGRRPNGVVERVSRHV